MLLRTSIVRAFRSIDSESRRFGRGTERFLMIPTTSTGIRLCRRTWCDAEERTIHSSVLIITLGLPAHIIGSLVNRCCSILKQLEFSF